MAMRRMFSRQIVQSSRFLKLSQEARLLYYDLGMAADDEGFAEAFCVLRMTGASDDVLEELRRTGFVEIINDDPVVHIVDWETNNQIRRDRFTQSRYSGMQPLDNQPATNGMADGKPNGNHTETEYSIGQDSIGQDSSTQADARFEQIWEAYPKKTDKADALSAFERIQPSEDLYRKILKSIQRHVASENWTKENGRYIPKLANWLERQQWNDEPQKNSLTGRADVTFDISAAEAQAAQGAPVYERRQQRRGV